MRMPVEAIRSIKVTYITGSIVPAGSSAEAAFIKRAISLAL
jgi:hypothetical protein